MSTNMKAVRDFLIFWIQVAVTLYYIPDQVDRMAVSTEGLLLTTFLLVDVFIIMNLILAIESHRSGPSKNTARAVIIYVQGVTLYTLFVAMFLYNSESWWKSKDTVAFVLCAIGIGYSCIYGIREKKGLSAPEMKMRLGLGFRIAPQAILAWNIIDEKKGGGLSGEFVLAFHVLVALRVSQIFLIFLENRSDKSRKALLIMELVNWASWCLVTAAWLAYKP